MYRPLVAGGVEAQKGGQSPPVGWHRAVPMYQELSSHPKLTWGWGQEGTHIVAPGDAGWATGAGSSELKPRKKPGFSSDEAFLLEGRE